MVYRFDLNKQTRKTDLIDTNCMNECENHQKFSVKRGISRKRRITLSSGFSFVRKTNIHRYFLALALVFGRARNEKRQKTSNGLTCDQNARRFIYNYSTIIIHMRLRRHGTKRSTSTERTTGRTCNIAYTATIAENIHFSAKFYGSFFLFVERNFFSCSLF